MHTGLVRSVFSGNEIGVRTARNVVSGSIPLGSHLGKDLTGALENRFLAGHRLPAPDGNVDIAGRNLDPEAAPLRAFGSEDRRSRTHKGIEHDLARGRDIADGI